MNKIKIGITHSNDSICWSSPNYQLCYATLVQHVSIPFARVVSIATTSTWIANEHIQDLEYKTHDTKCQCQLLSTFAPTRSAPMLSMNTSKVLNTRHTTRTLVVTQFHLKIERPESNRLRSYPATKTTLRGSNRVKLLFSSCIVWSAFKQICCNSALFVLLRLGNPFDNSDSSPPLGDPVDSDPPLPNFHHDSVGRREGGPG